MDYMEKRDGKGVRHARMANEALNCWMAWCGWIPAPFTTIMGGCIAPMIDCKRCIRIMRKEGWTG